MNANWRSAEWYLCSLDCTSGTSVSMSYQFTFGLWWTSGIFSACPFLLVSKQITAKLNTQVGVVDYWSYAHYKYLFPRVNGKDLWWLALAKIPLELRQAHFACNEVWGITLILCTCGRTCILAYIIPLNTNSNPYCVLMPLPYPSLSVIWHWILLTEPQNRHSYGHWMQHKSSCGYRTGMFQEFPAVWFLLSW